MCVYCDQWGVIGTQYVVIFLKCGVFSAKFWVITYDDAVLILNEQRIFGQAFTVDNIAKKGGKNLYQTMSRIQKVVGNIEERGVNRVFYLFVLLRDETKTPCYLVSLQNY